MAQREQREHVEFLYESMRATQGAPEFGLAVGQLLVAARRLLRAEYAEILLLAADAGRAVLRSISGPAGRGAHAPGDARAGRPARLRADRAGATARSCSAAAATRHPLDGFLASRGLGDAIVGALRGEERVFGFLLVGDRVGDVSTFAETTARCSRRSPATRASCSRTAGSSSRSPR